jgi:xanthine/uracil/vitamin C permease (AzgA family)
MSALLDRIFKLREHRTNVRTEVPAGLTTFAAMAYILAINPQILSTTGMDFGAVVTATALASAIMTIIFGLVTYSTTWSRSSACVLGSVFSIKRAGCRELVAHSKLTLPPPWSELR